MSLAVYICLGIGAVALIIYFVAKAFAKLMFAMMGIDLDDEKKNDSNP